MATTESKFENLKLTESTQKGKGEMLQAHKSSKDGKLQQSGEDFTDSAPSNRAQGALNLKGMVGNVPTQVVLPMKQEKRDGKLHQQGEDSSDAAPSNSAPPFLGLKESIMSTQMVQPMNEERDGKLHQPGEDSSDAAPSDRAPAVPGSKESIMFTQEVRPMNEERDGKLHQPGEDSSDAAPSNRAPAVPDSKESIMFTQEVQPENTERDEDVEMRGQEDSTDAMPFTRPTASAAAVQRPNLLVPGTKQKTRARPCPSAGPGPGARCEGGERLGAEGTTVEQAINLEEEKDLLLYEIAEKVAGVCDLRKMALRLRITESEVARMEHEFPRLVSQFYQVFQIISQRVPNASEMFKRLLEVLVKTDQESTAVWLRKRLGIKEPVASIEGEESSPITDVIPQREARQRSGNNEFYDIFLIHSGKSDSTQKFQSICQRHNWIVKTLDATPIGELPHDFIERILVTSTHLAVILTESDCIKYKNHEMSMTVEMALQLAYNHGELSGRVLPIRCCQKKRLPLVLQALTGAHIDEDSFEERLVETIDTSRRLARMRENQD